MRGLRSTVKSQIISKGSWGEATKAPRRANLWVFSPDGLPYFVRLRLPLRRRHLPTFAGAGALALNSRARCFEQRFQFSVLGLRGSMALPPPGRVVFGKCEK